MLVIYSRPEVVSRFRKKEVSVPKLLAGTVILVNFHGDHNNQREND
jgi:hypothetical protein